LGTLVCLFSHHLWPVASFMPCRRWLTRSAWATLTLQREPGNPHDSYAIQVLWHHHMLGYVPRRENRAIARALDQQMPLDARVVALRPDETPWKRLRFEISMPLEPDH
jgi:hypothetical protein